MTPNQNARISGFLYLLLIPLGVFGILYIPSNILIEGDLQATINSIISNEFVYRVCVLNGLIAQIIQIFLVLMLYKLLAHVNKFWAIFMVVFSLAAVPIAMLNEANLLVILHIIDNSELSVDLISVFLSVHKFGVIVAQFFWGLWLFPLGYLVVKSGFIPKIIGYFLMVGCLGYFMDSVLLILYPEFGVTVSEFTFLGEIMLPLWLIIKGVSSNKSKKMPRFTSTKKEIESFNFFI